MQSSAFSAAPKLGFPVAPCTIAHAFHDHYDPRYLSDVMIEPIRQKGDLDKRLSGFLTYESDVTLVEVHDQIMDAVRELEKIWDISFSWQPLSGSDAFTTPVGGPILPLVRACYAQRLRKLAEGGGCRFCGRDIQCMYIRKDFSVDDDELAKIYPQLEDVIYVRKLNEAQQFAFSAMMGIEVLSQCSQVSGPYVAHIFETDQLTTFLNPFIMFSLTWEQIELAYPKVKAIVDEWWGGYPIEGCPDLTDRQAWCDLFKQKSSHLPFI